MVEVHGFRKLGRPFEILSRGRPPGSPARIICVVNGSPSATRPPTSSCTPRTMSATFVESSASIAMPLYPVLCLIASGVSPRLSAPAASASSSGMRTEVPDACSSKTPMTVMP